MDTDRTLAKPRYVTLADAIAKKIHTGLLRPHESLPSIRTMKAETGYSTNTVLAC